MNPEPLPTIPVAPERPWRLSCYRYEDGVTTFRHERYPCREAASIAQDEQALSGAWDVVLLTPYPITGQHRPAAATKHIVAIGGRLIRREPRETTP